MFVFVYVSECAQFTITSVYVSGAAPRDCSISTERYVLSVPRWRVQHHITRNALRSQSRCAGFRVSEFLMACQKQRQSRKPLLLIGSTQVNRIMNDANTHTRFSHRSRATFHSNPLSFCPPMLECGPPQQHSYTDSSRMRL